MKCDTRSLKEEESQPGSGCLINLEVQTDLISTQSYLIGINGWEVGLIKCDTRSLKEEESVIAT